MRADCYRKQTKTFLRGCCCLKRLSILGMKVLAGSVLNNSFEIAVNTEDAIYLQCEKNALEIAYCKKIIQRDHKSRGNIAVD